jgi:Uma2 family endonuclease
MATIDKDTYRALTEVRPLPLTYTVDDLDFMPEDTNRYELIGGELHVSRAPHLDHQRLTRNLMFQFQLYLVEHSVGEIFTTPGIIFDPQNAVIPDLVFATHETIAKNVAGKDEKFDGKFIAAPELVIEIISMGKKDIERDRVYKRKLYGNFQVKEYWVVEGIFNTIEVYRLEENEQKLVKRFDLHESIETPLLANFSLKLSEIFRS